MIHDEAFFAETAQLAPLVARGDVAAFEVDGRLDVTPVGSERFTYTLVVLAHAAYAHRRRVLLRWHGDPVGSEAARRRTNANLSRLIEGIQVAYAQIEQHGASAPALVGIELVEMGPFAPAMDAALHRLSSVRGSFAIVSGPCGDAAGRRWVDRRRGWRRR